MESAVKRAVTKAVKTVKKAAAWPAPADRREIRVGSVGSGRFLPTVAEEEGVGPVIRWAKNVEPGAPPKPAPSAFIP